MQKLFTRLLKRDRNNKPPDREPSGEPSGPESQSRGNQEPKAGETQGGARGFAQGTSQEFRSGVEPGHGPVYRRGHQPEAGPPAVSPAETEPWVGVDLDGTLAVWDSGSTLDRIGKPVPAMLDFVKRMVDNGIRVKIFTARAGDPKQIPKVHKWLKSNGLPRLEVTNVKDYRMQQLYDDRCVQVEKNTGRIISDL